MCRVRQNARDPSTSHPGRDFDVTESRLTGRQESRVHRSDLCTVDDESPWTRLVLRPCQHKNSQPVNRSLITHCAHSLSLLLLLLLLLTKLKLITSQNSTHTEAKPY